MNADWSIPLTNLVDALLTVVSTLKARFKQCTLNI